MGVLVIAIRLVHGLTGSLAGLLALASLVACQRAPRKQGAPASSATNASMAPRLKLAQSKHELGPVVQNESVDGSIAVANDGSQPLVIERVKSSRFCSGSVHPNVLAPSASGKLEVACRSDLYGPLREVLEIQSNDPKSVRTTIQLVANVTPLLAFDTPSVNLSMFFGEERSQDVRLIGTLVHEARVKLKDPAVADVEILPILGNSGKPLGFRIHCKGRKVGTNVGNLFITTGLQHPREVAVPYACKVGGTLQVDPTTPYLNMKISGPKTVNIEVRSSQPDFQVQAVHVVEGPFAASFEPSGTARFRVKVTVVDQRIDDEARSATGKLVITSNDRTEPHKELPLFGFGRVNRVERPEIAR